MITTLCRVSRPERRLALHGVAATRAIEARAAAALPPHTLMNRAGLSVARCALAVAPHVRVVWVAAGPGNNGGDGIEAAVHLQAAGKQVIVTLLGEPERLPADARAALLKAQQAGVSFGPQPVQADLAIDGLLGLGGGDLCRPMPAPMLQTIEAINGFRGPRLAIDLPSGLNADTGNVAAAAVRATHTLSLLTLKPGLFTARGRDHAGDIWLDDLQVESLTDATAWLEGCEITDAWHQPREHASHKGRFGDVLVVGGAVGMQGAAALAARAAARAGAGRVFVSGLAEGIPQLLPELLWQPERAHDAQAVSQSTVVAGCGGGIAIAATLPMLLSRAPRLVLDADALNAIANNTTLQSLLQQRADRGAATVLTPHPLEAARLLGAAGAEAVQADRLLAATSLATRFGACVALKGSGTVIATPTASTTINPTGNGRLASAGTGDVLAGWMAGRWSTWPLADACAVAACAVWEHGLAAELDTAHAHAPLLASNLIDWLGKSAL